MNYLDLNGARVVSCRVTLPLFGAWVGNVELASDEDVAPVGSVATLTLGTLVLLGAVTRTASFAGARTVGLVGGTGGWSRTVSPRAYQNPAGVPAALVLGDVSLEVGEALVGVDPTKMVGSFFVRSEVPASQVLEQVIGSSWWLDVAGITHAEPRPPGLPIPTEYAIEEYDGQAGRLVASTEDLPSWAPGALLVSPHLDDTPTLSSVSFVARSDGRLRVEALTV